MPNQDPITPITPPAVNPVKPPIQPVQDLSATTGSATPPTQDSSAFVSTESLDVPPPPIVVSLDTPDATPVTTSPPATVSSEAGTSPASILPETPATGTDQAPPPLNVSPVVVTGGSGGGNLGKKMGRKGLVATVLGLLLLVGGVGAGLYLTGQKQDIREKAWFYSQDPAIGTQCPAFGGYTSEEIGKFQGNCVINYCPKGFGNACSVGVTTGAWSKDVPCNQITEAYGDNAGQYKNYCVQIDYFSENGKYCNIASPNCNTSNPPVGGCGAKELSQVDLNQNGVFNEAVDCVNTPTTPPVPTATPSNQYKCKEIRAYKVTGLIVVDDPTNWTLLTATDLQKLKAGDTIYYTVVGTSSDTTTANGGFDKGEFTVNGGAPVESTNIKPKAVTDTAGTVEFYYRYTIPTNRNNFDIKGRLHHLTAGWM